MISSDESNIIQKLCLYTQGHYFSFAKKYIEENINLFPLEMRQAYEVFESLFSFDIFMEIMSIYSSNYRTLSQIIADELTIPDVPIQYLDVLPLKNTKRGLEIISKISTPSTKSLVNFSINSLISFMSQSNIEVDFYYYAKIMSKIGSHHEAMSIILAGGWPYTFDHEEFPPEIINQALAQDIKFDPKNTCLMQSMMYFFQTNVMKEICSHRIRDLSVKSFDLGMFLSAVQKFSKDSTYLRTILQNCTHSPQEGDNFTIPFDLNLINERHVKDCFQLALSSLDENQKNLALFFLHCLYEAARESHHSEDCLTQFDYQFVGHVLKRTFNESNNMIRLIDRVSFWRLYE